MPTIAFGTWKIGNGQSPIDQVTQALDVGFTHVDTAQAYRNEVEAGKALAKVDRSKVFVTTKYSGLDGLDIDTSIRNSLKNLGTDYVDLYLIHHPRLAKPDIPTAWARMEALKKAGLARSIGVSNFEVADLAILLASAKVKPVANQILLHPYVYIRQLPLLAYCAKHDIVVEGYSGLIPITQYPDGPVSGVIGAISARESVAPEVVLTAWSKAKGATVVTTSRKKERLEGYLKAGDLALTTSDLAKIDAAGAKGIDAVGPFSDDEKAMMRKVESGADLEAATAPAPISQGRSAELTMLTALSALSVFVYFGLMTAEMAGFKVPFWVSPFMLLSIVLDRKAKKIRAANPGL